MEYLKDKHLAAVEPSPPTTQQNARKLTARRTRRYEIRKGGQLDCRELPNRLQSAILDLARSAQPGIHLRQFGVVVSGMGHKLPCARRQFLEQATQSRCVEGPCARHGDGSVRGDKVLVCEDAAGTRLQHTQCREFGNAHQGGAACRANSPFGLKGMANGADAGRAGGSQQGAQHCRKDVRVLVRVNMGESQAAVLQERNLRRRLRFNLLTADARL